MVLKLIETEDAAQKIYDVFIPITIQDVITKQSKERRYRGVRHTFSYVATTRLGATPECKVITPCIKGSSAPAYHHN